MPGSPGQVARGPARAPPSPRGQEQASRGPCPCRSGPAGFARFGRGMPAIGPVECMSEAAPNPQLAGVGEPLSDATRCSCPKGGPTASHRTVTEGSQTGGGNQPRLVTSWRPGTPVTVTVCPDIWHLGFRAGRGLGRALVSRPERLLDKAPLCLAWPCLPLPTHEMSRHWRPSPDPAMATPPGRRLTL